MLKNTAVLISTILVILPLFHGSVYASRKHVYVPVAVAEDIQLSKRLNVRVSSEISALKVRFENNVNEAINIYGSFTDPKTDDYNLLLTRLNAIKETELETIGKRGLAFRGELKKMVGAETTETISGPLKNWVILFHASLLQAVNSCYAHAEKKVRTLLKIKDSEPAMSF